MAKHNDNKARFCASLALVALSFGAIACGGDDDSDDAGNKPITLPDGGKGPLDSGVGSIDSGVGTGDSGTDGGGVKANPGCVEKPGCTCTPATSVQFLNSCTTATCYPFDNGGRIKNFTGTLPALQ